MNARFRLLVFLSLCGLLLNVLLLYWKITDPAHGVVGCGGGGCGEILSSRWSMVWGIPVPAFGVAAYVLLYAALLWRKEAAAAFCFAAIAGAAVWFIFVQTAFLRHYCPWCMAAHGIGCGIALLGLIGDKWDLRFIHGLQAGAAAALCLALAQLYGPVASSHRIDAVSSATAAVPGGIHSRGTGRKITFDDGKKIYDIPALPRIGSADAKQVMVEYFDYRCPACRRMRGYLEALVAKHPVDISILLLPVPLDHECNSALSPMDGGHPGSCQLTKIALAVWRAKPEAFPVLHARLMSDPPMDEAAALEFARELTGSAKLNAAGNDPWIGELIQADIADWVAFSGKTKQLPKLLIRGKRILHGLPSGEADFIRVMEKELGL
ncbi:MAG: vitamin K epoxide reductase family protein [Verrucomicrobiota bacterium]